MSAFAHHDPRYPHYITALNHRHCFLRRPMRAMTKGRAQDTKKHLPMPDHEPRRCRLITSGGVKLGINFYSPHTDFN